MNIYKKKKKKNQTESESILEQKQQNTTCGVDEGVESKHSYMEEEETSYRGDNCGGL